MTLNREIAVNFNRRNGSVIWSNDGNTPNLELMGFGFGDDNNLIYQDEGKKRQRTVTDLNGMIRSFSLTVGFAKQGSREL